jgi:hypothetical protein
MFQPKSSYIRRRYTEKIISRDIDSFVLSCFNILYIMKRSPKVVNMIT